MAREGTGETPCATSYEQIRPWPTFAPGVLDGLMIARRLEIVNLALVMTPPDLTQRLERHAAALRDGRR